MSVDEVIGGGSALGASRAELLPALVARAQSGDETAWEKLLDSQCRDKVKNAARRRGISDEDVLDDAWDKAIKKAKAGIGNLEGDFDNWFSVIFYRTAIDANIKESERLKRYPLVAGPDDVAGLVGAAPSAEDEVLSEVAFKGLLDRALKGMPEAQREALRARVETGLKGDALAKELTERLRKRLRETGRTDVEVSKIDVSATAANANLSRARQRVKDRIVAAWLADKGHRCQTVNKYVKGRDFPLPDEINAKIRRHYKKSRLGMNCPDCRATMELYPLTDKQMELFIDKIASSSPIPLTPVSVSPWTSASSKAASGIIHGVVHNKVAVAILVGGLTVSGAAGLALLKSPDVQTSPAPGPAPTIDPAPSGAASRPSGSSSATLATPPPGELGHNPTGPASIDGNSSSSSTGDISNPPSSVMPISPTIAPPPTNTLSPPTSTLSPPGVPTYEYTTVPEMAGTWLMTFDRTSGAMDVEHYAITLNRTESSRCASASPCWVGRWRNLDVNNEEASDFTVTISLSGAELKLSGTEVDNPQKEPQHYDGTAPNDTRITKLKFTGSWRQSSQTATFVLTQK
jgi:DNA-directed RNA polymerase specialized sigma24 family protein